MTQSRSEQVSLEATPFYHCYVRCVRRAFLCGRDSVSGADYEHRKQWVVSRLRFLSYIYAIDICAYAVMSNHYHVVLHVDLARAKAWSSREVAERWMQLYSGDMLVSRWLEHPESLDVAALAKVDEIVEVWRSRLCCISWFMRGANETIARMANEEENCKGRFWEGRFKSQALLDEAALLSCMAYVDLNPVRAAMEPDLAHSSFTSIQQRIADYAKDKLRPSAVEVSATRCVERQARLKADLGLQNQPDAPLMPFGGSAHVSVHSAIPFTREDYFELVDSTGRLIREDKRGFIGSDVPPLLQQLGINPDRWVDHVRNFNKNYGSSAGSGDKLRAYAELFGRAWGKGVCCSNLAYSS